MMVPAMTGMRLRATSTGHHVPVIVWTVRDLSVDERRQLHEASATVISKSAGGSGTLVEELGRTEKFREPPPLSNEKKTPLDFVTLQLSKVNWQKGGVLLAGLAMVAILVLIIWWWNSRRVATPTAPSPIPAARYSRPTTDTLPLTNRPPRK